ncbi:SCP2 sterol-binding domain-containing protein [Achromobacter sp. F4_2707]|uniref:ubiquinone biosynthesis accessory factor UbiJ n=1 Tax=Achromobacter sp. F4_2707 TaxID=3114286 RepID=UPI0039C64AB5
MLPLPSVFSPNVMTAFLLNALLRREPWAADKLSRHAGKSLRFNVGRLQVIYSIEATGMLRASHPAVVPDVSLSIATEHLVDLPGILRGGDLDAITEKLHVQGDAALATLVSELARDLRWDIEEDLASRFGDLIGPGLVQGGRTAVGFADSAARRLAANAAEFLGEEGQVLATRHGVSAFNADCAALQRRLDALEQRVANAERAAAES